MSTPYGEPVGLAAIVRDITVLKKLGQMKNDFVNTVSHDLKNPITVISAAAQLMLRDTTAHPHQAARCELILQAADYMNGLVVDLLDLGKIESGLESPSENVDLVPLVRDAVATVKSDAEIKDITLTIEAPRQALVTATPQRIKQALINSIGNAVKYTPAGGRTTVTVTPADGASSGGPGVVVAVTDTGIGIAAADIPYVFDKFYRVKSDATRNIQGTGLGLAITKSIIEGHGGRIWVESQEGQGSTFFFSLTAG